LAIWKKNPFLDQSDFDERSDAERKTCGFGTGA